MKRFFNFSFFICVFSIDQWLDQPINVPLDEYAIQTIHDARVQTVKANTAQLLNEFNHVYNSVEFTHLTPPQTPPQISPETSPRAYLDDSSKVCIVFVLYQVQSFLTFLYKFTESIRILLTTLHWQYHRLSIATI